MAATVALFCPHKRLRTACVECTPTLSPPSPFDEDDAPKRLRRR